MKTLLPILVVAGLIGGGCQAPDTTGEKFLRHPKAVILRDPPPADATPRTDAAPASDITTAR